MGRKEILSIGELRHWENILNKAADTVNSRKSKSDNFSSFIFFTDMHWEKNNKNAVSVTNYLKPRIGTKTVITGGDIIMGQPYKRKAQMLFDNWLDNMSLLGKDGWYAVRGNHDNNGCGVEFSSKDVYTDDEFYDAVLQYSNNANANKNIYNYFDDSTAKIRYYFLDTGASGRAPVTPSELNKVSYEKQLEWLKDTASELNSDWAIIIIQHRAFTAFPYEEGLCFDKATQAIFPVTDGNVKPEFDDEGHLIAPILHMKKGKKYMVCDEFTAAIVPVLNEIKKNIDVIGVISGHTHLDCDIITPQGYPIIATTCDAGGSSA